VPAVVVVEWLIVARVPVFVQLYTTVDVDDLTLVA
jgi:hypothetical protein